MTKPCKMCKIVKTPSDFYGETGKTCKSCTSTYQKQKRLDNRYDLKKFGITKDDYEALLKKQQNKCAICSKPAKAPAEGKKFERCLLAVDHCHETNQVRGLLCHNCNVFIGLAHENLEVLRNAITYLEVGAGGTRGT